MEDITARVKKYLQSLGADIVGTAPVERFEDYPRGHRPEDLLPGAKSVLAFGIRILESHMDWPRLFQNSDHIPEDHRKAVAGGHFYMRTAYETINARLEQIAMDAARRLEDEGFEAMYFPATYAHHAPIMEKVKDFMPPFPHRGAAARAGLGEYGYNNLFLSTRFGPRVRLNSVLTTAVLNPDPLIEKPLCLREACMRCVRECPAGCIQPREDETARAVFLNPPSRFRERLCLEGHGQNSECPGGCIRVCPVGRRRKI